MNKTVTINLSGIVFHIDENAYEVLKKYLDNLKLHFAGTQGKEEIIADIETRFAEMFSDKVGTSKNVITIVDVNDVIALMGKPEEVAASDDASSRERATKNEDVYYESTKKRFFRNPDDKMLGGVCGGISAYFDIDPILMRLAFVLLVIFAGTGILAYIILWIIIPEAKTATEKLQMKGERVNISNIEKSVREEMENLKKRGEAFAKDISSDEMKSRVRTSAQKVGDIFLEILRALGKFIGAIFGFIITALSIAVLVGLTVAIFSGVGVIHFMVPSTLTNMVLSQSQLWWLIIGGVLAIGIPFTLLLLNGLKLLFRVKLNLKMIGAVMVGFWILGIGICIFVGLRIASEFSSSATNKQTVMLMNTPSDKIYVKAENYYAFPDNRQHDFSLNDLFYVKENEDSIACRFVNFDVEKSEDSSAYINERVYARGKSFDEAKRLANSVNYQYAVTNSQVVLSNYYTMSSNEKYRGQNVHLVLKLPVGKSVVLDKSLGNMLNDVSNTMDAYDDEMPGHEWKMTDDGLKCMDCPDNMNRSRKEYNHHGKKITIDNDHVTIESEHNN